jgi:hypothetical protein
MPVTDKQIQAAIARKQQSSPVQRGVNDEQIQAAIARKLQEQQSSVGVERPESTPELLSMADKAFERMGEIDEDRSADAKQREANRLQGIKDDATVRRMRTVLTEGPRLAGSIAGGIMGGPPGAALLGGAGELLGESIGLLVGSPEEKEEASKKEFIGLVKDISIKTGEAGIEEGLWDLAGGALAKTGRFAFSPIIKKIAPKAAAMSNMFAKLGGKFSPAELDKRGIIKFLESASRNSLEGKELFKAFVDQPADRAMNKMMKIIASDLSEGVGKLEPDMVADALTRSIKGIDSSFEEVLGPAWGQLDTITKGATVETAGLHEFVEKEIFELAEIADIGKSEALGTLIDRIDRLPPHVSFAGMRRIKRNLFKQIKSLEISGDIADGMAKKLGSLADEALLDPKTVKGASKEAKLLHSNLGSAYSTGKTAFKDAFPSKIIDGLTDPRKKAAVVGKLFPDKGIDNIRNIRNTLTKTIRGKANKEGAKTWGKLQRLWLEDLVTRSTDASGKLLTDSLENNITKFGPSAAKEILGPEHAKALRLVRGIAKEKGVKRTNLAFLVRSVQIGGALTAVSGFKGEDDLVTIGAGGAVALTPAVFALLSGSRSGNALLRAGVRLPKGSKSLPAIVIKLNAAIRRERKKDK